MKAEEKKTPKVPLGKPLQLTDQQLEEIANVMPADIAKAEALWRNSVPKKFKTLLDAQSVEDKPA